MATLELRYGGVTFAAAEVLIRKRGYYLKGLLSQKGYRQVGHLYMMAGPSGQANTNPNAAVVDASVDQELEIVLIPESDEEFTQYDFLILKSLVVELLTDVVTGEAMARAVFEVPNFTARIAWAAFEAANALSRGVVYQTEMEIPQNIGYVMQAELEFPITIGIIAQAEFETP